MLRQKGRDLTQSYDKSPYTNRKSKKQRDNKNTPPRTSGLLSRTNEILSRTNDLLSHTNEILSYIIIKTTSIFLYSVGSYCIFILVLCSVRIHVLK